MEKFVYYKGKWLINKFLSSFHIFLQVMQKTITNTLYKL